MLARPATLRAPVPASWQDTIRPGRAPVYREFPIPARGEFSHPILERHGAVALWTTVGAAVVGLTALVGLVRCRDRGPPRRYATIMLLLTLGLSGMMGWTVNLGGQVMHQEIRPAGSLQVDTGTPAGGAEAEDHEDE